MNSEIQSGDNKINKIFVELLWEGVGQTVKDGSTALFDSAYAAFNDGNMAIGRNIFSP